MSEDSKYLARIAQLESDNAGLKKAATRAGIDPRELAVDPSAALSKAGVSPTDITNLLIAQAMGDKAPQELKVLLKTGQQVNAAHTALSSEVKTLSQRLAEYESRDAKAAARKSFIALASDKQKYPTLAAAVERDPSMFDEELSGGDAADADRLEARYARVVAPKAPAAIDSSAAKDAGQSTQAKATEDKSAGVGTAGGAIVLPAIPTPHTTGPVTAEAHEAIKQAVLQQAQAGNK